MRSLCGGGYVRSGGAARVLLLVGLSLMAVGCGANPRMVPLPKETADPDKTQVRSYDFNCDGKAEYREILDSAGRVRYQEFDRNGDGTFEEVLDRAALDPNKTKHIFLLLDGVPYSLMDEMWQEGHFRLFSRPGRMVSTFPSLTDPAFYQVFRCGKPYGYEAEFCDRASGKEVGGASFYVSGKNEAWVCGTDHRINLLEDAVMYLFPGGVFKREMVSCQTVLDQKKDEQIIVLYLLSTDGICHMFSREEAKVRLAEFDRWVEQMVYEAHGKVHLTMFADHGNNFVSRQYIDTRKVLKLAGLRVTDRLNKSGDVIAPRFGLINFATICCYGPQEQQQAVRAMVAQEGVDAVAWQADDGMHVASRGGTALVRRRVAGNTSFYSYQPTDGDPLNLADAVADLRAKGMVDSDGFISDDVWFQATKAGPQPFAVPRLYGALHYNVINPADIVISLADGYYCGDPALMKWVKLRGTHGGLSRESTVSFLMSTAFVSPEYVRTEEVLPIINEYVGWTPHIDWVDYSWLDKYRALQGAPLVQKAGSPLWPSTQPAVSPQTREGISNSR